MTSLELYLNIIIVCLLVVLVYFFYNKYTAQRTEKSRLMRKLKELEELDYTKQVFLTAMSHQLRTPLSGAKWAIELILKNKTCSEQDLLNDSLNRVNKSIEIINKIIKTAELEVEKGDISIKMVNLDLKTLVDHLIAEQDYLIKDKGIKLKYEKYESVVIKGDEQMLRLALINIIDNAFRYSPHGIIKINLFKGNKEAVLTVGDNGIGIDPKDLEFITIQKYYRGKNAMAVDPNESGVGLYVTRKIIEIHGGQIAISSTLNKGTKVSVAFPLAASV